MKRSDMHTEEQIRKTMQILEEVPELTASPTFGVRLNEKIDAASRAATRCCSPEEFKVRVALAMALLFVNIGAVALFFTPADPLSIADTGKSTIEQLSDDYAGTSTAYYMDSVDADRHPPETDERMQKKPQPEP